VVHKARLLQEGAKSKVWSF